MMAFAWAVSRFAVYCVAWCAVTAACSWLTKAFMSAIAASLLPARAACFALATSTSSCVRTCWHMNGAAETSFHSRSNRVSRAVVPAEGALLEGGAGAAPGLAYCVALLGAGLGRSEER